MNRIKTFITLVLLSFSLASVSQPATLPATVDVTAIGAATYTIPIEVVPGTKGVQPTLSITYNSVSGLGILGARWSMSGISSITRSGQGRRFDGNIKAVLFDTSDRFSLDGKRLLPMTGTDYNGNGVIYCFEVEDFTRVERKTENGHQYFMSTQRDGTVVEYGRTADSRFTSSGTDVLTWMVNKVMDADGNYMKYHYRQADGEILLDSIDYTFLADGTPSFASVEFLYGAVAHPNDSYVCGRKVRQSKKLTRIDVKFQNQIVRSYRFKYEIGTQYECLKKVELYNPDGQQLTATQFQWGDLFEMETSDIQLPVLQSGFRVVAGNFDDDRIYDAIAISDVTDRLLFLNGTPDGLDADARILSHQISPNDYSDLRSSAMAVDIDGDGIDELLYWKTSSLQWVVLRVSGTQLVPEQTVHMTTPNTFFADFDGDAVPEMVSYSGDGYFYSKGFEGMTDPNYHAFRSLCQQAGDFDGDGKMDILLVADSQKYRIYTYDLRSLQWRQMEADSSAGIRSYCIVGNFNGDGMTDLLTCTPGESSWRVAIRQGSGSWLFTEVQGLDSSPSNLNGMMPRHIPLVCDINGDGKSDILQETSNGSIRYFITDGVYDGNYQFLETGIILLAQGQVFKPGYFSTGDFDGNGIPDFIFCNRESGMVTGSVKYLCRNRFPVYFVERVTDGAQKKTFFDYKSISLMPDRCHGDGMNWVTYPLVSGMRVSDGIGDYDTTLFFYGGAMHESVTRIFAGFSHFGMIHGGKICETHFSWLPRDGQSHFDLLVVDSVVTSLVSSPTPTPRLYSPGNEPFVPFTVSRISKTSNANMSLHRTNAIGNITYMPYSSETTEEDFLTNSRVVTQTTMGCNSGMWLPSRREVVHGYISSPYNPIVSNAADYTYTTVTVPNGSVVVKPSMQTTNDYNSAIGSCHRKDTVRYTYGNGGRLASMRHSDNGVIDVTESYTYNTVGVPLTESIAPIGVSPRTNTFIYDPTSRFVTSATDHAGNTTLRAFDPATGLCISETDCNGFQTTHTYDALGRPVLTTFPDGTTRATAYTDNGASGMSNVSGHVTVSESGKPQTTAYYDCLGRVIQTLTAGQGKIHTEYDHKGRIAWQSAVPTSGTETAVTCFWYDNFGRLVKDSSLHSVNRYFYGIENGGHHHYETVENAMGSQSTKLYDAAGRVAEVRDGGGTVKYEYDRYIDNGRVLDRTIIITGGNTTTILADSRGNRTRLVDPDAGTTTSTYNPWGKPVTQTDGKGDVTSMTYDSQGRMVTKSYTLGVATETYSYTYGTDAPSKGKLVRVSKDDNTCLEYGYDALGRVSSVTRHISGTSYTHTYSYDADGKLETVEFPDGFTLRREYDTYGRLKCLKDNSTGEEIYSVASRNKLGQPKVCWFGNETGVRYSYDDAGKPTNIRYGYRMFEQLRDSVESNQDNNENRDGAINPGIDDPEMPIDPGLYCYVGSQYSDLSYTYNGNGYIVAKEESVNNQQEEYGYDGLGRLTSFTVNGIIAYDFEYDNSGNMTMNSRIGSTYYTYGPGRPHAVTGVTDENGVISSAQCDVTYGSRNRATSIIEDGWKLDIGYGIGLQREKSVLSHGETTVRTTHYISGDCEREITASGSRHIDYIFADGRIVALHVYNTTAESDSIYYVQTDLLGSWNRIVDQDRNVVQSSHFDPWGNRMKSEDWTASMDGTDLPFHRGFTGHEHYDRFGIINMNARLYDPVIARFFSPDPQIQDPYSTQGFNRYSYCGNNPVMYIDEDGEFAWFIPAIVGAIVGSYSGGVIANNRNMKFWQWDFNSKTTWGYMAGGAIVGFVSGWVGGAIATSQIPMANTISGMASSFINSLGTSMYTDGQTPVSISFGIASFNLLEGRLHSFSNKNKWYENISYGIGAMSIVSDLLMGLNPQEVDLVTEHSYKPGHSAIVEPGSMTGHESNPDPNGIISVGPDKHSNGSWHWMKGTNQWETHTGDGSTIWRQTINVNKSTINKYASWLNKLEDSGKLIYSVEFSSCVTHTSLALNMSGIFNIGVHPYNLALQMFFWHNGVRPWSFTNYLDLK